MANDNITIKIKAINETSGSINEINNSLDNTQNKVKTLSKGFDSVGNGLNNIKGLAGIAGGVLATLSIANFIGEIAKSANEFDKLNAKINALNSNSQKAAKDFETIKNFEGINLFDKQDIQETYNILRSQNIEFNEDILRTLSDTSLATNQNIVTVAEQYRAILNGETASLDDYYKSVVKTSDGILVQFFDKSGQLQTKLLNDSKTHTESLKSMYSGVTEKLNETAEQQFEVYKQKFFNRMGENILRIENEFIQFANRTMNYFENGNFKTTFEMKVDTNLEKVNEQTQKIKEYQKIVNQFKNDDRYTKESSAYSQLIKLENELNIATEKRFKFKGEEVVKQQEVNKSLEGSLVLYKDLNKELKDIKDIKGVDTFLKGIDKNNQNILGTNFDQLKQDAEKQKQIIKNLEQDKIDIKVQKLNLESQILKGNKEAQIELIKLNSREEIANLTETGEQRVALERAILSKQNGEIDKFHKEQLEKQKEQNLKLSKLKEEIEILKVNNNNDLNQFEKDNIINKRNLLARQRDELNVKDLTNSEKKLLEEKHLLEIESLEKESLDRRKRFELESKSNVLDMKLKNKDSLSNDLSKQGLPGETGANLNDLMNNLDSKNLEDTRNLKLEQTKIFYDQEIQAARDRNASLEEINLLQAEKDKSIVDIQQQYTLGSLQNMQSSLTSFQGILSNLSTLVGGENKKMFRLQQGIQIAQAVMNTGLGITRALAEGGPFAGPILAGVIGAMGFAQVAQITAQKPKYHDGGMIKNGGKLSNEVDTTLQTGEGVLSRRGMIALDRLNRGDSMNNNNSGSNGNNNIYLDKDKMIESILKDRTFKNNVKSMTSN